MTPVTSGISAKRKARILIVDDHPLILRALKQLISQDGTMTVCAEAMEVDHALEAAGRFKPDLAVVDLSLKDRSGLELIKKILKNRYPKLPVLVLSVHDEFFYAERALQIGATAYVMGKTNASVLHTPEDIQAGLPKKIMAAALRDGKWEGTINRVRKNETRFAARVVITPRRDAIDKPIGYLLISKDISDEIRPTEELKATQFYTRSLIELCQARKQRVSPPIESRFRHTPFRQTFPNRTARSNGIPASPPAQAPSE